MRSALAFLAALSASGSLAPAQTSKEASVGVFPFLVGNLDPQIQTIVQDAVQNDLDILYVSAFRATGPSTGQLWITDRAGTWNPSWGAVRSGGAGIDLQALCRAAHAGGLQVVAVIKCFDSTVQPTDVAHRAYLLEVVRYLVDSYDANGDPVYDVDGLALDYIRWVGGGGTRDPRLVTDFCRDVKQICGALTLHAYLLAGRYDFDGPVYDGNFNPYASVISVLANGYGQHWEQMARHVDVLMPMAYTADGSIYSTYALHQAYVRTTAAYAKTAAARAGFPFRRVAPAIKTYSDGETTTPQTIEASITGALQGGNGYQAFRWGTMRNQPTWWAKMKQFAAPGQNRPVPAAAQQQLGLTARVDPSASVDPDNTPGGLEVRFDWDNDGTWDTPYGPVAQTHDVRFPRPGESRQVGIEVRDGDGLVGATRRAPRASLRPLVASSRTMSAGAGGALHLDVEPGPAAAGDTCVVLAGVSGSTPGLPLAPGFVLPMNYDGVTAALIASINTPLFLNAVSTVDASGRVRATFQVPPGLLGVLLLRTFTWAGFGASPTGQASFVTNAEEVMVVF